MSKRRTNAGRWGAILAGAAVLFCAVLVRSLYLYDSSDNPTFSAPIVDSLSYDLMARDAVEGSGITRDFFWQQFFYPCFLSIVYLFSGCSIIWAKVVQIILGSITCVITYRLGRKIFGRATGVLAGLMAAVYGPLIFFEAELLAAGWAAFWAGALILLLLEAGEKKSLRLCFILGLCSALSVINRPNFIPFLLAAGVWLVTIWVRAGASGKKVGAGLLLIGSGFCLVVMPVAVKNFQVTSRFSFVPGTSGLNLYIGNNPDFEAVALRPGTEWEKVVALPLREGFKSPRGRQHFYYARTIQYIREQPGSFVKGLLRKSKEFASTREMPGHVDVYMFTKWSPLLGVLVWKAGGFGFPFGVLVPLALLGIFVYWKKVPVPVWLFLVFYSASVILTHVEARYRIPVVIAMCPFAGAGLVKIAGLIRLKRWLSLAAAVVFCVGAAGLCSIAGPFYSERHVNYEAELHYVLASSLQYRGRFAEAEQSYKKAITLRPDYVEAYQNLGLLLTGQGKFDEAVSHYDRALVMFPNDAGLHEGLGIAFLELGRTGDAIECYRKAIEIDPWRASAYDNLGTAFFELNRLPEAHQNYGKAVEMNPEDPVTHTNFGCLLAAQGQFDEAIEHFETSLRIRPNQAQTLSNLASAFASLGKFDKAAEKFRDALRLAPDDAETWFNLGLCLEEQGRTDEAVRAYRKALAIDPGHERVRNALRKEQQPRGPVE